LDPRRHPRRTPDRPQTAPVTGHPAGALPRSGTSVCAPLCRCVVRCRPFGAARGDCAGPGRGVGREALSRCGVSGCSTGGHGCPRGRAGRGGPVAKQGRDRGWPSRPRRGPVAKQGRDRGGRAGRAGRVGRAGNRAETGVAERSAVLPCCRAAVLPCCRVPELPRARGCPRWPRSSGVTISDYLVTSCDHSVMCATLRDSARRKQEAEL